MKGKKVVKTEPHQGKATPGVLQRIEKEGKEEPIF